MSIVPRTENERRSRRFKGLVAGVAGVAMLLGGATFANWSDSFGSDLDSVNNGDLDISGGSAKYYDLGTAGGDDAITTDSVTDITAAVQAGTWRAVPGDTLEVDIAATIKLAGANMNAKLELAPASGTIDPATSGWELTYRVYEDTGSWNLIDSGTIGSSFSAASPVELFSGLTEADNDKEIAVVFLATLPGTLTGQNHTTTLEPGAKLALESVRVTLSQV